ncbi:transposase, partial [Sulfurihydrogenibium azorense]
RKGDYKITLKEFKENYNDLFPYVPQLPAIVKRAKKLYKLAQVISIILTNLFSEKITTVYIADTKPIPVCKNQRMKRNKKVSGKLYKGNNAAKEWFGFKIGLIVDYYKRPIGYEIIPASKHDINFLKEVKEDSVLIDILNKGTIIADKAFNSKDLKEEFKSLGIELEAIRKKG